ncbi:MAG: methyltransferase FkbM family [Caulobacteraceae bacterium]|nr:methyltransferase FkbM family [Caulobacteraceae bacterium]
MNRFTRFLLTTLWRRYSITVCRAGAEGIALERSCLRRFFGEFEVDCVFDVGANAGQYAGLLREIGFRGPIISFEPIPELAEKLVQAARSDPHWYIEQVALDDQVKQVSFNVMASTFFSSLREPIEKLDETFSELNVVERSVDMTTNVLDYYFEKYESRLGFCRPFLKMDTQGNDLAVARGAGDKLRKFVGIQSELAVKPLYKDQPDYREVLSFYGEKGFNLSALLQNHLHFPDLVEVDCIMVNRDLLS